MTAKARPVEGRLRGDAVAVDDPAAANRLHARSQAGTPEPGGALRLTLPEAAHCVASGWLEVQGPAGPVGVTGLLQAGDARRAATDYLAYRDLRGRGLVARPAQAPGHFDVWPRGASSGPAAMQILAAAAEDPIPLEALRDAAQGGLVLAVVDADGLLTHYRVGWEDLRGKLSPLRGGPWRARAVAGRAVVEEGPAVAALEGGHVGTRDGDRLLLSGTESEALRLDGLLDVPPLDAQAEQVAVVRALRAAGAVARSGLRFGAHLRAYRSDPQQEHADWLVHCARADRPLGWDEVARGVRLAHGVRKTFVVALPASGPDGVRFAAVQWLRL